MVIVLGGLLVFKWLVFWVFHEFSLVGGVGSYVKMRRF